MISVLGDEEKRALYDQTGCVDDEVSDSGYDVFFKRNSLYIVDQYIYIDICMLLKFLTMIIRAW